MHSVLKTVNTAVISIAAVAIAGVLLFSGFMMWDNHQIYAAAENVMLEMKEYKPTPGPDGKLDFGELLEINPDVKLWLTLDGTDIDTPVVQGRDNYYYLNRDVFGKLSMAGAVYLDCRNSSDFSDIYNIIYGHHMKGSLMFGDLDNYMDAEFFGKNTTGTFLLPDGSKPFETLAVMKILDSSDDIFRPTVYSDDLSPLCDFIKAHAAHVSGSAMDKLTAAPGDWQVTALVTCTDGNTGTRLVLLVMSPYDKPDEPVEPDEPDEPTDPTDPDEPTEPDDPTDPDNPDEPGEPTEPSDPSIPGTGDSFSILALIAILSCALCLLPKPKKQQDSI